MPNWLASFAVVWKLIPLEKPVVPWNIVNAPAGTKRVIYAEEDSIFVNVHPNPDNITDTDELENILACTSYKEYDEYKLLKE